MLEGTLAVIPEIIQVEPVCQVQVGKGTPAPDPPFLL